MIKRQKYILHGPFALSQTRIILVLGIVFTLSLVSWKWISVAEDNEPSRVSLRGLQGVEVIIGPLIHELETHGMSKKRLQRDTEHQLRNSGVNVYRQKELLGIPGHPQLYIHVDAIKHSDTEVYGFRFELALRQEVILSRNPEITVLGTTWSLDRSGLLGIQRMSQIREFIAEDVDKFIHAYLEMNPVKNNKEG
jgi:hypothetical protein